MLARRWKSYGWFLLVVLLTLTGCASPPPAPIDSRKPPPSNKINVHYVSKGDTLFSIAWSYEKDVHKLARANGLRKPYTIYQGQRLTLDTTHLPALPSPAIPRSHESKPVSKDKTSGQQTGRASSVKTASSAVSVSKPAALPSRWSWQWPVPGSVTRQFNADALFKGIDLRVRPGQPVVAAGPGVVVYAGSGLRGYGKMIIIKHSEIYLSAYAHNRKILVKEGQEIKAGQVISEAGGDHANNRRLYFEIRKDGKPVDPRYYLPKR